MQSTSEKFAQENRCNGINMNDLMETVGAIQADPELGVSRFRASNTWLSGNHNRSTVTGFFGARQEIAHQQTFTMDADEPPILAGHDQAANPVEHLLHALASCLTTSLVAHAAVKGIEIQELESELEGDIDLNGFLGLDASVPKGYTDIRVNFRVKVKPEDLPRIRKLAAFSPVYNTVSKGTNIDLNIDLM